MTHWLYPIAAGGGCRDAAGVRETLRRGTADWALATNFHKVRRGDLVWIYSGGAEQIVTALAVAVDDPHRESGKWFVRLEPDWAVTDYLASTPLPRTLFRQVPYSVSRATPVTQGYLVAVLQAVS